MIDDKMMARLRTHSKQHKGGMGSKHVRSMKKSLEEGMSFTKAHNKAKKMYPKKEDEKKEQSPTPKEKKSKPMGMKKTKVMGKSSY